uniref:Uncharacterized protein n=1 Tax=Panagrolaimus sp. JU765 TaxID=591449 RepID=A0AC34QDG6_9BILA
MEEEDVIGLSNVTWPRSRIPAKLLSELQATSQLQSTLSALKTRATQQNDAETIKMIEKLNQILTKDDPADDPTMPNQNQTVNSRIGNGFINRMRRNTLASQPPHFGSMILCAKPNDPHVRSSNHFVDEDGQVVEEPQPSTTNAATNEAIPESEIPLYAKVIPTILLFLLSTGYIFGGTYVFQTLDPSLGNKSFHEVFMLPFQINFTVGWGNLPIVTTLGQLFCILYALCG